MKRTFTFISAMTLSSILLYRLHFLFIIVPILLSWYYVKKQYRFIAIFCILLVVTSLTLHDRHYSNYQEIATDSVAVKIKPYGSDYQIKLDDYMILLKSDQSLKPGEYLISYNKFQFFYQNPNTFSYKNYLRSLGFVDVVKLENCTLKAMKTYTRYNLPKRSFDHSRYSEYYKALIYADKSNLEQEIFQENGTSHVLAISGLHIGLIFGLCYGLFSFLNKWRRQVFSLFLVLIYVLIINSPVSAVRAWVMLLFIFIAYISDRKYDLLQSIGLLSVIMMVMNPYILYHTGFQFSYCAVLVIEVLYKPLLKHISKPLATLLLPMVIQIGMMPLTIYHQNMVFLLSFIVNIISVVLIGFVLYTLILYLFIPFNIILDFADFVFGFLYKINLQFAQLDYFKLTLPSLNLVWVVLFYVTLLLYREKRIRKALISVILMTILIVGCYQNIVVEIYFLDIGQGDCTLIKKGSQTLLIDGGNISEENLLKEVLLKQGINSIDVVMLSHSDMDHLGGLTQISEMTKKSTLLYREPNDRVKEFYDLKALKRIPCTNQLIDLDFVDFECLDYQVGDSNNNSSLIGYLNIYDTSIFFTGDIEAVIEEKLLLKPVDILKVPHHGSLSSSTENFIDALSPEIAVICVGKNFYGHPSKEVICRYKSRNIPVYKTIEGCVKVWVLPFDIYFVKTLN